MPYKIIIEETVLKPEDLTELLDEIQQKIREGYTSGYYPTWSIEETE